MNMKIKSETYNYILNTIGALPPERGGILGSLDMETISHFYYDINGVSTKYSYTPNVKEINSVLEDWSEKGIYLVGIVHSHNPECKYPSCMDIEYAERILKGLSHTDELYLPILICDNELSIVTYKVFLDSDKNLKTTQVQIEII